MIDDYIIELPWLENIINFDSLLKNYKYPEDKDDPWRGVNCYEVETTQPELKDFLQIANSKHFSKPPSYWLTYKSAETYISAHTDNTRDAVLLFPITPPTHRINFLSDVNDESSIIHYYDYRCPTIPNAKIPHCVFDKGIERYFLQISLHFKDYSWKNLQDWIINRELF